MTIEQFERLPDDGVRRELVQGRIVEMGPSKPRHGIVCLHIGSILHDFVAEHRLGRVGSNDFGIVTRRAPDTLRGADVSYISYQRVPREADDRHYFDVTPELVCEVMSEYDRWSEMMHKAAEYLSAGVVVVCVFDTDSETVTLLRSNREPEVLHIDDTFQVPDILPGLSVPVHAFFV
jgi:Uma2 family endonuclease